MSSDAPVSVVFVGLSATGKTTFLVALWHTVLHSEAPGALSLVNIYEGDRAYITKRHKEWLQYEAVSRTWVDCDTPILMTLRDQQSEQQIQLAIPDLSGETYKVQFEERRVSTTLVEAMKRATGIALFINPTKVVDPTKIRDVWDAVENDADQDEQESAPPEQDQRLVGRRADSAAEGVTEPEGGGAAVWREVNHASTDPSTDFNASRCCTQVKYVDLLQQLVEHVPKQPIRCAVIVSAIDTLDGTEFQDCPEKFISARMSMLNQYLMANRHFYDSRVYGVSAQGGKYDPLTIKALGKSGPHRIRVCVNGQRDNDISRPIRWLAFGGDGKE